MKAPLVQGNSVRFALEEEVFSVPGRAPPPLLRKQSSIKLVAFEESASPVVSGLATPPQSRILV